MGVIPMGEHYKSIFLSVIILADKFRLADIHLTVSALTDTGKLPILS